MADQTIEHIQSKLQTILNRKFANDSSVKRKIDVYHDRLSCACPFCCDSRTDTRKKRGNLYLNSLHYFCFNCGYSIGVNGLLNAFGEELSPNDKVYVHDVQQSSKKFERRVSPSQSSMSFRILEKVGIPKAIFFKSNKLVSPYKNEFASGYLKSRKIEIKRWNYFAFKPDTKELYILNLTPNDSIIGYQIRQLDPNSKKSRYLTRNLTRMYDELFKRDITTIVEKVLSKEELGDKYLQEEDGIENIVANLDMLSGLFNVMNVDMGRDLTIVEGPIDSLCIDNCIALQGATKMNDYFDDIRGVRYLFDNDAVGKQQSINKLKNNKKVFLWGLYLKKLNLSGVKDVNDLKKMDKFDEVLFNECFSDDSLDVVMI